MFVKLQLDTSCFRDFCSTRTSAPNNSGVSVSVSPIERKIELTNKHRDKTLLQNYSIEGVKKLNGVSNHYKYDKPNSVVYEPELKKQSYEQNSYREHRKDTWVDARIINKGSSGVKFGVNMNGSMQAKCSTKWASYGGCIPSILQALDTVKDLSEALGPWAESLSNKERSIILKEQSSCERALEIFEWFKRKGCYELNVIHYNIQLPPCIQLRTQPNSTARPSEQSDVNGSSVFQIRKLKTIFRLLRTDSGH